MREQKGAFGAILDKSCIRHIQRGYGTMSSDTSSVNITLSGFHDDTKMLAIVNGNKFSSSGSYNDLVPSSVTVDKLTISQLGTIYLTEGVFSYQVIEFY